jgi:hypothetical protein
MGILYVELLRKCVLCILIHTHDVTQCSSLRSCGRPNDYNVRQFLSHDSLGEFRELMKPEAG